MSSVSSAVFDKALKINNILCKTVQSLEKFYLNLLAMIAKNSSNYPKSAVYKEKNKLFYAMYKEILQLLKKILRNNAIFIEKKAQELAQIAKIKEKNSPFTAMFKEILQLVVK